MIERQHDFELVIAAACQLVARDRGVQRVEVLVRHHPAPEDLMRLQHLARQSGLGMWIWEGNDVVLEVFSRLPAPPGDAHD